jgi:ABC-2 type transport system permease protein
MTAISSAGWNGMAFIDDMERGVMNRFLVAPVWRPALNLGSMAYGVFTIAVQSLIIVGLAYLLGAHFENGIVGIAVLLLVACLLGGSFAALSNALSLVARQRETLIGAVTFVLLPLTFLSGAFMQLSLAPSWIADAARFNPVNWSVAAARGAGARDADWSLVGTRLGMLTVLLVVSTMLATRAFRAYQHSL